MNETLTKSRFEKTLETFRGKKEGLCPPCYGFKMSMEEIQKFPAIGRQLLPCTPGSEKSDEK